MATAVLAGELPTGTAPGSLTCQPPGPPIINGERATVCRGETVALTATGCLGTVIWSTGEQGAGVRVTPYQTTRYTAVCRLPDGCVSCFAEAYTVTVGTPEAPKVTTETPVICAGDAATLVAANCSGTVQWSDGSLIGSSRTVQVEQTTVFQATCVKAGCASSPSAPLTLRVSMPTVPVLTRLSGGNEVCTGQSVQLNAGQCAGEVRWSDGGLGVDRTLTASQTLRLRAVCRVGTCQSDSSNVLTISVQPARVTPLLRTTVQNVCPFLTADLAQAIGESFQPALTYTFRTGPAPDAAEVSSPGAVLSGIYYISARTFEGCLSRPVAVSVVITPCANGIAPCLSNPPTLSLSLDTLDQKRGLVCLKARLRGMNATDIQLDSAWTCSGTGLFTGQQTLQPRYVASEADRQKGTVTFAINTPDPDGAGPCVPGAARLAVVLSGSALVNPDSTNVVIKLPDEPEVGRVFIPEGFSPNGDGINDRFVIQGVPAMATVDLTIFNRWGHQVYADANYKNDWEGQANQGIRPTSSQGLPDGTYFYVVRISDGREYVRFLTIAR
ncbi:gliding motility-associated C-terminal domain-containing protein [Fibrella aquatica]|uniref:gliding motility-associated C-terminal domain-containing protein n=1 Tax=Fibrella aquatica TaxID=3242487 RepID=UPI0035206616